MPGLYWAIRKDERLFFKRGRTRAGRTTEGRERRTLDRNKNGPEGIAPQGSAGHSSRPGLVIPCRDARQQSPTPFRQAPHSITTFFLPWYALENASVNYPRFDTRKQILRKSKFGCGEAALGFALESTRGRCRLRHSNWKTIAPTKAWCTRCGKSCASRRRCESCLPSDRTGSQAVSRS